MTGLAIAGALVGLAATAAFWDVARRALDTQRAKADAAARLDVEATLADFEERILTCEGEAREAVARCRKAGLGEVMGRR